MATEGKLRRNKSYLERRAKVVLSGSLVEPKTKVCSKCKKRLQTKRFAWHSKKFGRRHSTCIKCKKIQRTAYYENNVDTFVRRNKRRYVKILEFVQSLKTGPCSDCGNPFPPECMDFDHRDASTKVDKVSRLAQNCGSKKKILEEVAKCDLVCACCHRIRTKRRRDDGRRKERGG